MGNVLEFISISASPLVTMIVTVSILSWLRSRARFTPPSFFENEEGLISPGKMSAWFTVIVGLLMLVGGVMLSLISGSFILGVSLVVFGGGIAGFMSPSLSSIHDVRWNVVGVEGACRTFGPTLGRERTMIVWGDIIKTGKTITDYWYIEASDGRRIYWSYLYPGYGVFMNVIATKCPDIQTSKL